MNGKYSRENREEWKQTLGRDGYQGTFSLTHAGLWLMGFQFQHQLIGKFTILIKKKKKKQSISKRYYKHSALNLSSLLLKTEGHRLTSTYSIIAK